VKLVNASDGSDVPGGAVAIATSGGTAGQFAYGSLSSSVTLAAGSTYWIVSQEIFNGDTWYDYNTVITTTNAAAATGATYGHGSGDWWVFPDANRSYVPVDFKYSVATLPPPPPSTAYVTGFGLGTLRNDYSGWVGMRIVVGGNSLPVTQLGRIIAPGNTGAHTVKLVNASDGSDVPGGAVTIPTSGGTVGQFQYGTLSSPVTLVAGSTYWIVSQELFGGDTWYDYNTVITTTGAAAATGATYGRGSGDWWVFPDPNRSYVPVDFKYGE
jgi:hypothetical protein